MKIACIVTLKMNEAIKAGTMADTTYNTSICINTVNELKRISQISVCKCVCVSECIVKFNFIMNQSIEICMSSS